MCRREIVVIALSYIVPVEPGVLIWRECGSLACGRQGVDVTARAVERVKGIEPSS
jgi:hypothetical protein